MRIATGGPEGKVKVWSAVHLNTEPQLSLKLHKCCTSNAHGTIYGVSDVAWSPCGTRVASAGHDGHVYVIDAHAVSGLLALTDVVLANNSALNSDSANGKGGEAE